MMMSEEPFSNDGMEEEHEESKELLQSLFDHSPDALFIEDESGIILKVNAAACALHGISKEELVGKTIYDFIPVAMHDTIREQYPKWFNGELVESQSFCLNNEGEEIPIELRGNPVNYKGQRCILISARDIRGRIALKRTLRITQKIDALGQIARNLAHDLNNHMTAILGFSNLILDSDLKNTAQMELEEIIKSAEKAATITSRLLTFNRKEKTNSKIIDITQFLTNLAPFLKTLLGEQYELVLVTQDDLYIHGSETALEQVFINLLLNAKEAQPEGGKIWVSAGRINNPNEVPKSFPLTPGSEILRLDIRDQGHGIPEDIQDKIFDPFFTSRSQEAYGLGLTTVYHIIHDMKGEVTVQSTPGEGATFSLFLPLEHPEVEKDPVAPSAFLSHLNILVVEDDAMIRSFLRAHFERHGCNITLTGLATEALDHIFSEENPFDLIITDIVMPQMSGIVMAKKIRDAGNPVPILFISGYSDQLDSIQEHFDKWNTELLIKPFTGHKLDAKLHQFLDQIPKNKA